MQEELFFSSRSCEWETPPQLFNELNEEFHFTLDACASEENAKCERFYTKEQNSLSQPWEGRVFCNPPYSKGIGKWIRKASEEIRKNAELIVLLIPARTETMWFHDYLYEKPNVELRFIKGRIKFLGGEYVRNAPFPSMLAIMRKEKRDADTCN